MSEKLQITNLNTAGKINVRIMRQDVAPGEPSSLQCEHEIPAGECATLVMYSGSAMIITDDSTPSKFGIDHIES